MKNFIDKSGSVSGTPLNRKNLMGLQGFVPSEITFDAQGNITETYDYGDGVKETKTTTFNADGSIVETFRGGTTQISKTTRFLSNGDIDVTVSEVIS